jgi:hypothetical protein
MRRVAVLIACALLIALAAGAIDAVNQSPTSQVEKASAGSRKCIRIGRLRWCFRASSADTLKLVGIARALKQSRIAALQRLREQTGITATYVLDLSAEHQLPNQLICTNTGNAQYTCSSP